MSGYDSFYSRVISRASKHLLRVIKSSSNDNPYEKAKELMLYYDVLGDYLRDYCKYLNESIINNDKKTV